MFTWAATRVFFGVVLKYMRKYWLEIFFISVVAGVGIYIMSLRNTIENHEETIIELKEDVEFYSGELVSCRTDFKKLRDKVVDFSKESEQKQKEIEDLQEQIDAILDSNIDADGNDVDVDTPAPESCEGASQYLIDRLEDIRW